MRSLHSLWGEMVWSDLTKVRSLHSLWGEMMSDLTKGEKFAFIVGGDGVV